MCLENKFQIPETQETVVSKPEVEQLFEEHIPFAVVKAMPGFGKTTACALAAKKHRDTVGWYSLDVTDNDSGCFLFGLEQLWEHLEQRRYICRANCSASTVLPAGTDGEADGGSGERSAAVRMLSLVQRVKQWETPIHIVWDNFQVISSDEIFQLFLFFMYYTKEKISCIFLTSRNVPTVFLPLVSREEGRILSEDSLRLTPEEAWESMAKNSVCSQKLLNLLADDLCGWPMGIQWVLKYLQEEHRRRVLDGTPQEKDKPHQQCGEKQKKSGQSVLHKYEQEHSRRTWEPETSIWKRMLQETMLSEYLDRILWKDCPENLRNFFKKSAVFETFTWEMYEAVSAELPSSQDFMETVACYGFVEKVPGQEGAYRYGRAFRAYFYSRLSEKERGEIYRQAALWFEKKQNFVSMAQCAISGKQEDVLNGAIEQYGGELLCKKNRWVLGRMIEYLEKNAVLLLPETAGIVAQYFYSQGSYYKMEKYLDAADRAYGKENKYGHYRSLYCALVELEQNGEYCEKQIQCALYFLKKSGMRLPFLTKHDEKKLQMLTAKEEETGRKAVCVNMFGNWRVVMTAQGKELAWRTKKSRELFAYLLDTGGSGVGRRQLIELLWQDEIPGNAVAMLHNMFYNIRKELSACHLESLITYENRAYRLHMENIKTDLQQIKTLTTLVEKKDVSGLRKEYKSFLEYWGSYLEDLDSLWVEERRAFYDEVFKNGCWILADCFAKEKEYETALKLYKNILSLDAYSEETVEKMILIYGKQKSWKKLKLCYENLETVLKKDLGILPGENVRAAYHKYL